MSHVSICIPTYEMHGKGASFLQFSLERLRQQTFKDFDIIISDHSVTDEIKNICNNHSSGLAITYIRNAKNIGNSPANTNNAIRHAQGKIIKILFQDDFLYDRYSLENIVRAFDTEKDRWLVTACTHSTDGITFFRPLFPRYNNKIHLGKNTISSPSVLAIKNEDPLLFDENLVWSMDCDYYKRCHDAYGAPVILDEICVVNRIGQHQISSTATDERKKVQEYEYILRKHKERWINFRIGFRKSKIALRRLVKRMLS